MGDRIAVMKDGIIQQIDHPGKVYDHPSNQFVGGFIGNPPMNFMTGQVQRENGAMKVRIGDFDLEPHQAMQPRLKKYDGQTDHDRHPRREYGNLQQASRRCLPGAVLVVEPLGSQNLLTVKIGEDLVKVSTHPDFQAAPDTDVWLRFPADKIRWMDPETGEGLYPTA
jgi:multiple sugar transport system ATP-binding protein